MVLSLLASAVAVAALLVLVSQQCHVRGTTLRGPWLWSCSSLACLAAIELTVVTTAPSTSAANAWRFLAAASTLCPGMAILGAKRPQDRAWQWIVASFWMILSLPAIQLLVVGRGGAMDIHPARAWFLVAVVLFSAGNMALVRRWPLVLATVVGQLLMLQPYLAERPWRPDLSHPAGMSLVALAAVLVPLFPAAASPRGEYDRLWLDFRERFGIVWSMRLMERVNTTAQQNGWDLLLTWSGFCNRVGQPTVALTPEQQRVFTQSLKNLLRRFVSPEWIEQRLPQETSPPV